MNKGCSITLVKSNWKGHQPSVTSALFYDHILTLADCMTARVLLAWLIHAAPSSFCPTLHHNAQYQKVLPGGTTTDVDGRTEKDISSAK